MNQYNEGDTEDAFIWMDRTNDELLECERGEVQKMLGRLEAERYNP